MLLFDGDDMIFKRLFSGSFWRN